MATITAESKTFIQTTLDACTANGGTQTGIPGLVFCAIDKHGTFLTQQASGQLGQQNATPTSPDTVFFVASCTKMITGIACMQLVEQGVFHLDDPEVVYKYCPELKDKKVLLESGELVPRKTDITLRLLLTHRAGIGYSIFNNRLKRWSHPAGQDPFSGDVDDYLIPPLVNQPGEKWEYGANIDWAGFMVERATNMTLETYFQKNIFAPLGIKDISFLPNESMRRRMVTMQQREADGTAEDADHLSRRSLVAAAEGPSSSIKLNCAGGAGCFATVPDYCQLLTTLLNDGTSPTTGAQILKPETVKEMFTNQIPDTPNFGRNALECAKPRFSNHLPELFPQPNQPPQGWGLTFLMTLDPEPMTGRGANTGAWAGITNQFWWVDRSRGVAGMIAAQILPFGDPAVIGTWLGCEKAVYDGLQQA